MIPYGKSLINGGSAPQPRLIGCLLEFIYLADAAMEQLDTLEEEKEAETIERLTLIHARLGKVLVNLKNKRSAKDAERINRGNRLLQEAGLCR